MRFDKKLLDSLTEDELALLYLLYYKIFDKKIDLRCVFVQPVLSKIKERTDLNTDGIKVRDILVKKIEDYYI